MKDDDSVELLIEKLRWLRLPGMVSLVPTLLAQAATDNLTLPDVLHRLADEEKQSRMRAAVTRRVSDAKFPEINTVDGFDFDFSACRKKMRARYLGLHDLAFLEQGINPLFIGTPGTGKTFLARSLAYKACQMARRVVLVAAPKMLNELHAAELHGSLEKALRRYVRAELLAIDDFAVLAMDPAQAKLAFQVISERYDYRRSTMITTNRPFKDWTKVFPDSLSSEMETIWPQIEGKCATSQDDLKAASQMATRLTRVVGLREQAPAVLAALTEERLRAFTLMMKVYDEARSAVGYLRRHEGDADSIAPLLYTGKSTRRKATETDPTVPVDPAPAPPPPAAAVPVPAPVTNNNPVISKNGPFAS